jgi:hypothetical protein
MLLNGFYRYRSVDELQADLDCWINEYNEARPHQGRLVLRKAANAAFLDAMPKMQPS